MKALQRMCEALGPSLFEEVASHDFVQFLLGTLSHTNRFVRETGFFTVASIVRLASLPFLAEYVVYPLRNLVVMHSGLFVFPHRL